MIKFSGIVRCRSRHIRNNLRDFGEFSFIRKLSITYGFVPVWLASIVRSAERSRCTRVRSRGLQPTLIVLVRWIKIEIPIFDFRSRLLFYWPRIATLLPQPASWATEHFRNRSLLRMDWRLVLVLSFRFVCPCGGRVPPTSRLVRFGNSGDTKINPAEIGFHRSPV